MFVSFRRTLLEVEVEASRRELKESLEHIGPGVGKLVVPSSCNNRGKIVNQMHLMLLGNCWHGFTDKGKLLGRISDNSLVGVTDHPESQAVLGSCDSWLEGRKAGLGENVGSVGNWLGNSGPLGN